VLARGAADGRVVAGDLVLFTSGSTGRPRGVVRTAQSWRASVAPLSALTGIGAGDVVWLPGPLSSSLFLHGGWHAAAVGARTLAQPGPPARATALHAVPALLADALDAADAGLLPRLRTAVVAGDALPAVLRERARRHGWTLVEYYGAAELSFVAWRGDGGPFVAFPGADVRVRDGRVEVCSPYLARGYLGRDDTGPLRRCGAWAGVGDRAEEVPGGLRLLGRGDDAVVTGGASVVAAEVEAVLREVPGVAEVAVVALPHPRLGAVVAAAAVPAAGAAWPSVRAALAEASRSLPPAARPRRWARLDRMPRTAAGKSDRAAVAELLRGGAARTPPPA
jgi:long-chain acyl-CoA synthetase